METPEGLKCFSLPLDADDHKSVVFYTAVHASKSICVLLTGCCSTSKWLKLSFSHSSSSSPPEELSMVEHRPLVWGKVVRSTYYAALDVGNERWTDNHERIREVVDYCAKTQQHHLRPSDPPADDFHCGWYRIFCCDFSRISDPDRRDSAATWNEGRRVEGNHERNRRCQILCYYRIREIKENTRCELDRFNREKRVHLLNMLKGFVNVQIECAEKMADEWSTVAEGTSSYAMKNT